MTTQDLTLASITNAFNVDANSQVTTLIPANLASGTATAGQVPVYQSPTLATWGNAFSAQQVSLASSGAVLTFAGSAGVSTVSITSGITFTVGSFVQFSNTLGDYLYQVTASSSGSLSFTPGLAAFVGTGSTVFRATINSSVTTGVLPGTNVTLRQVGTSVQIGANTQTVNVGGSPISSIVASAPLTISNSGGIATIANQTLLDYTSVQAATTPASAYTAIPSGLAVVDGYQTVAGDSILIKDTASPLTSASQGIYTVSASAVWAYASSPVVGRYNNLVTVIGNGTVNRGNSFLQTAAVTTLGTSPQSWVQFSSVSGGTLQSVLTNGKTANAAACDGTTFFNDLTAPLRLSNINSFPQIRWNAASPVGIGVDNNSNLLLQPYLSILIGSTNSTLVNGLQISPSASGSNVILSTYGTDANIGMTLSCKGSARVIVPTANALQPAGGIELNSGTTATPAFAAPLIAGNAATPTALSAGSAGQVLTSAGANKTPYWSTAATVTLQAALAGGNTATAAVCDNLTLFNDLTTTLRFNSNTSLPQINWVNATYPISLNPDGNGNLVLNSANQFIVRGGISFNSGTVATPAYAAPLFAANAAISPTAINAGTASQILTSAGTGKSPYWTSAITGASVVDLVEPFSTITATSSAISIDASASSVFYTTNLTGATVLTITNITTPLSSNNLVYSCAVISAQTAITNFINAVAIAGATTTTVRWNNNNTAPTAGSSATDLYQISVMRISAGVYLVLIAQILY